MNDKNTPLKNALPWGMSWLTLLLAVLAIGTFFAVSNSGRYYITPMMGGGVMGTTQAVPPTSAGMPERDASVSNVSAPDMKGNSMYYPYPYPNPDVPVGDTREFLKVYYNASMQTRDVPALTRRVETTVRGHNGRIDQQSSSSKYGSVSFAVPQNKYDAFRTELESLVGSRFISVNISSQNLLSQKVSIEEQQKQADTSLSDYKTMRQKIVNAHASAASSLQSKIDADTQKLTTLRAQPSTPQIVAEIQVVSDNQISLKQQLARENASYAEQLKNVDANIKYAGEWQKAVETQDQTLLDNVATVTGTVSIQWISFWGIVLLYLPGYWIPAIFAMLAILSFMRDRRRVVVD